MKSIKKVSLMMAAVLAIGGTAMAEKAPEGKRGMDPAQHVEKMTERMVKEYNLNDTQKQQLLDLNKTFSEKRGDRPAGPGHHGKKGKQGDMAKDGKRDKPNKDGNLTREKRERKENDQAHADRPQRPERKNLPDTPKPTAEEREKRIQEMKQKRADYNAQLQKIMNAEQYQAYTKNMTEREQKRQERGEKMKEGRAKKSASAKNSKQV